MPRVAPSAQGESQGSGRQQTTRCPGAVDRRLQIEELARRRTPREALRVLPATRAVDAQCMERSAAQVAIQHRCVAVADDVERPRHRKAATGVPQASASSITRPKVSVRLGNTNTSALAYRRASSARGSTPTKCTSG